MAAPTRAAADLMRECTAELDDVPQVDDREFADLLLKVGNMSEDRDRMRLIKTAARNFKFTCEQAAQLCQGPHYGDAQVEAAKLLWSRCVDPDSAALIIQAFRWDEDRLALCKELGVAWEEDPDGRS
eukprot:PLAT13965.1.p2 GENE.PLAT13965.1~~PLAT13965.1.p2  ORF type:complete len:135 (-),score=49.58 PLAT13965.1:78-458(-)